MIGVSALAGMEGAYAATLGHVRERHMFGQPLFGQQNTRFKLAEVVTQIMVGRAFIDRLVREHMAGQHLVKECSMAKLWQTEMLGEVVDECLQFFGGWGYMWEFPIARAFVDARMGRIGGGSVEVMKQIIARSMLPDNRKLAR